MVAHPSIGDRTGPAGVCGRTQPGDAEGHADLWRRSRQEYGVGQGVSLSQSEGKPGELVEENRIRELAGLFLRLGATAFGGPAAHIGMLRDEVVARRAWLTDAEFLDLLGATNLIPGPNSTELAIHIGYWRAGRRGMLVAGVCFILPAMLIVLGLAWAYVRWGSLPQMAGMLYGVKPVVLAVVALALWGLGRTAIKNWWAAAGGLTLLALNLAGWNEIGLLALAAMVTVAVANWRQWLPRASAGVLALWNQAGLWASAGWAQSDIEKNLGSLFLIFLKIGAVLYGSGYVLLAFLRADFVERLGWLTDAQLIDAVAVGQVTPGPVFTTATFIGYVLAGVPGAAVATIAIFLPSFIFVALTHPVLPTLLKVTWLRTALNGVNVASLALMAAVTLQLGRAALTDLWSGLLFAASLVLLGRYKVNSTWLILGGLLFGWLVQR
ncbi:MAG: chromate efflux transporter [Anaerolineae bacterium]|nr:MAG: chromate efflux transporter [Anaerolineae bacterium]